MRFTNAIALAIIAFTSSQALAMPVPNPWDAPAGPRQNPAQGHNVNIGGHRAPGGHAAHVAHAPHHRRDMEYLQARMDANPTHNQQAPFIHAPAVPVPFCGVPRPGPTRTNAGHAPQAPKAHHHRRDIEYLQARMENNRHNNNAANHTPTPTPTHNQQAPVAHANATPVPFRGVPRPSRPPGGGSRRRRRSMEYLQERMVPVGKHQAANHHHGGGSIQAGGGCGMQGGNPTACTSAGRSCLGRPGACHLMPAGLTGPGEPCHNVTCV